MEIRDFGNFEKIPLKQNITKNEPWVNKNSFSEIITKKHEQLHVEKLNQLLHDIDLQGKIIVKSRKVENLRTYKTLIKEFLHNAVEYGLKLEERKNPNGRGRMKIDKLIEEVDKKLIDLTNQILGEQNEGIDILASIDEIKGLLISIYI